MHIFANEITFLICKKSQNKICKNVLVSSFLTSCYFFNIATGLLVTPSLVKQWQCTASRSRTRNALIAEVIDVIVRAELPKETSH